MMLQRLREYLEKRMVEKIKTRPLPFHVGIIPDGSRRYGKKKGLNYYETYHVASNTLEDIILAASDLGLPMLTVWVFSTDNFNRPKEQVDLFMQMAKKRIEEISTSDHIVERGIVVNIIGNYDLLPDDVREVCLKVMERNDQIPPNKKKMTVNLLMAYGGRDDILSAIEMIRQWDSSVKITEKLFSLHLQVPVDVDLVIRTSGEKRLSGFTTWQSTYAELYFEKKLWPEFTRYGFYKAILDYQRRERRFGK